MVEPCAVMRVRIRYTSKSTFTPSATACSYDEVLVEETEGVLGGRGGQPDEEGVEVLQHLPPQGVNGAVALVDHDDVEVLRRVGVVVDHGERLLHRSPGELEQRRFLHFGVEVGLTLQHRVEPLHGRDDDLGGGSDGVRGEPLDVVQLGEFPVVVGRAVALELLLGLLAEVRPVDQEQHAPRAPELDQPVGGGDRHDRLPRARRHLHQRAGPVPEQRVLQVDNGLQLVGEEERPLHRRHRPQARAEGRGPGVLGGGEVARALHPGVEGFGGHPLGEGCRLVHLEDAAAARIGSRRFVNFVIAPVER
jgi:hypothetical protein